MIKVVQTRRTRGGRAAVIRIIAALVIWAGVTPYAVGQDIDLAIARDANVVMSRDVELPLDTRIPIQTGQHVMRADDEEIPVVYVEVDGLSYREAAAGLGIKLENLKMVIFRARRKIHRAMRRVFDGLPPDCRPARDPRPVLDPQVLEGPSPDVTPGKATGGSSKCPR